MATPYFEEVQRLRDNRWIIALLIVIGVMSVFPFVFGLYWQVGQGVPFGNKPMTNTELVIMLFVMVFAVGMMAFVMMTLRLEVRIDEDGIHYRMFPVKWEWRVVKPVEIAEYTFADRYKLFETGGIGHHRNVLKKMRSFRISGGKHITIRFNDGHRLLLGTQDLTGMEWAMRKLMKKN
jgi:hypothetical protein